MARLTSRRYAEPLTFEWELRAGQLETVQRVTRTAEQEASAAVYGVSRVQEFMELGEAAGLLEGLFDDNS